MAEQRRQDSLTAVAAEQSRLAAIAEQARQDSIAAAQAEAQRLAQRQAAEAEAERRAQLAATEQARQDSLLAERQGMSEAGINRLYEEYIAKADELFDAKQYNVSRAWYYKAWDVKPQESYPKEQIDEINRLVRALLNNQRDRDYQQYVDRADSTFRDHQLAVSRGWYNRALTVKPEESYPREQLQAIAILVAERLASRSGEQFQLFTTRAGEALESRNFNVARFWYRKALELRPDDENVRNGLQRVEEALK